LSGAQIGMMHIESLFAERDAMPLRETHDIKVVSPAPAPFDEVTYHEVGEWTLTSRTPST
jgi:hypothetical protein